MGSGGPVPNKPLTTLSLHRDLGGNLGIQGHRKAASLPSFLAAARARTYGDRRGGGSDDDMESLGCKAVARERFRRQMSSDALFRALDFQEKA